MLNTQPITECIKQKKDSFNTGVEHRSSSHHLTFAATKTVLNVKMDVSDMTNIAVSKQKWTGWPPTISDELSLAQIDIPKQHELTVNVATSQSSPSVRKSCDPRTLEIIVFT